MTCLRYVLRSLLFCAKGNHLLTFNDFRVPVRTFVEIWQHNLMHFFGLCQLANSNQNFCTFPQRCRAGRQGFRKSFLTAIFTSTLGLLPFTMFLASFKALLTLSHSPSGAPKARQTTCSFAVSSKCNFGSLFGSTKQTAARALHTTPATHTVLCTPFSVAGGHPPQEIFHNEPQTMLTYG